MYKLTLNKLLLLLNTVTYINIIDNTFDITPFYEVTLENSYSFDKFILEVLIALLSNKTYIFKTN